MTISIICGFLPTFFLSPFAGVWADRYNRKTLIVMLVFGPVSDFIKIEWLLIGTGILMLIETVLMFVDKVLIDAGEPI